MTSYTVLAEAVTIATGRINPQNKKPEVVRLLKGAQIEADPSNSAILTFLDGKAIRPTADVTGSEKITARHIMRAFKDSVTAKPNKAVEAIPAPMPVTDPNEL